MYLYFNINISLKLYVGVVQLERHVWEITIQVNNFIY